MQVLNHCAFVNKQWHSVLNAGFLNASIVWQDSPTSTYRTRLWKETDPMYLMLNCFHVITTLGEKVRLFHHRRRHVSKGTVRSASFTLKYTRNRRYAQFYRTNTLYGLNDPCSRTMWWYEYGFPTNPSLFTITFWPSLITHTPRRASWQITWSHSAHDNSLTSRNRWKYASSLHIVYFLVGSHILVRTVHNKK